MTVRKMRVMVCETISYKNQEPDLLSGLKPNKYSDDPV
jgi:hypothetical protein